MVEGVEFARKATRLEDDGQCNELAALGGPMIQGRVTRAASGQGFLPETVPTEATHVATLNPPALFGGGLIQSILAEDLLAMEDPDDLNRDGISGRAVRKSDGSIGRFGLKASHSTLESFVSEALLVEMGLTPPGVDRDLTVGGRHVGDGARDPEVTQLQVDRLVDFVSFLAPAAVAPRRDAGEHASGSALFGGIGCADCHTPLQTAGPQAPGNAAGHVFPLYSDLLLHDLGGDAVGHCTPDASVSEWRTAPLAGLRYRTALFHDGRVESLERAIARHGGEAAGVRSRYDALSVEDRRRLWSFLSSL